MAEESAPTDLTYLPPPPVAPTERTVRVLPSTEAACRASYMPANVLGAVSSGFFSTTVTGAGAISALGSV